MGAPQTPRTQRSDPSSQGGVLGFFFLPESTSGWGVCVLLEMGKIVKSGQSGGWKTQTGCQFTGPVFKEAKSLCSAPR